MKKILSLTLALIFVLFLAAVAQGTASKTVKDMTIITTNAEGLIIYIDDEDEDALVELDKLMADGAEVYFGEEVMSKARELLEKDEVEVTEYAAIFVANYKEEMGDVVANMLFPTRVEEGRKAVMLIGLKNSEDEYEWKEYEAIGVEDGSMDVLFDGETLQRIQDETGMFALVL